MDVQSSKILRTRFDSTKEQEMMTRSSTLGAVSAAETLDPGRHSLPATPFGLCLSPSGFRLPEATRLGPVTLQVGDLERSLDYYQPVLGLRLLGRDGRAADLGTPSGEPLVQLRGRQGVGPRPGGRIGLFHFALLLPDRPSLARFARHSAERAAVRETPSPSAISCVEKW
jgi:catechol 2,3-dioxygenase